MLIQHKTSEPLLTVMWLPLYCDQGLISNHAWHTMQWGLKTPFYDVLVEWQTPFGWFYFFYRVATAPSGTRSSHYGRFMIILRYATLGTTPLNEWSAQRRDLYLTTQHSQETNIHAPGGIRTHNPIKRTAANPRPRPRGNWDQQMTSSQKLN